MRTQKLHSSVPSARGMRTSGRARLGIRMKGISPRGSASRGSVRPVGTTASAARSRRTSSGSGTAGMLRSSPGPTGTAMARTEDFSPAFKRYPRTLSSLLSFVLLPDMMKVFLFGVIWLCKSKGAGFQSEFFLSYI